MPNGTAANGDKEGLSLSSSLYISSTQSSHCRKPFLHRYACLFSAYGRQALADRGVQSGKYGSGSSSGLSSRGLNRKSLVGSEKPTTGGRSGLSSGSVAVSIGQLRG